jgi:hypothetical protein
MTNKCTEVRILFTWGRLNSLRLRGGLDSDKRRLISGSNTPFQIKTSKKNFKNFNTLQRKRKNSFVFSKNFVKNRQTTRERESVCHCVIMCLRVCTEGTSPKFVVLQITSSCCLAKVILSFADVRPSHVDLSRCF